MLLSQNITIAKEYHISRVEMGKKVGLIWIGLKVGGREFYLNWKISITELVYSAVMSYQQQRGSKKSEGIKDY